MLTVSALMQAHVRDGLAAVDARVLLCAVLGVDAVFLIAHGDEAVDARHEAQFRALAARRLAGEPVAYLVGEREFFGHVFKVTPAVLIPRPETELLVELALERKPRRVLDLGTGSGCIAISIALALPDASVTALDRSDAALAVARANAVRLDAPNVEFKHSDWYAVVRGQCVDVIVSNPPYVAAGDAHLSQGDLCFEPASALASGAGEIVGPDRRYAGFVNGADLVIHDAQYTASEYPSKVGWGHSTVEYAVHVCSEAAVKTVALTHHDPLRDDRAVDRTRQPGRQSQRHLHRTQRGP